VTELVATFFTVHCSLSFLADVYGDGLFNPSNGSIRFPVDHRIICPVYHMVFLQEALGFHVNIAHCNDAGRQFPRKVDQWLRKEWACKVFGKIALKAPEEGVENCYFFLTSSMHCFCHFCHFSVTVSTKLGTNTWIHIHINHIEAELWNFSVKQSHLPKSAF